MCIRVRVTEYVCLWALCVHVSVREGERALFFFLLPSWAHHGQGCHHPRNVNVGYHPIIGKENASRGVLSQLLIIIFNKQREHGEPVKAGALMYLQSSHTVHVLSWFPR